MCQSARVYRSYLKKLHQKNEKATIQNEQFEKQSEELHDHTRHIANYFCDWVQNIPGEDVNCNPKEDEILSWFAIGQDALEFQESHSCLTATTKELENKICGSNKNLKPNQLQKKSVAEPFPGLKSSVVKKVYDPLKKGNPDELPADELLDIETRKLELSIPTRSSLRDLAKYFIRYASKMPQVHYFLNETKLHGLNSTSLLREFKNKQSGAYANPDRAICNNSNYIV